MKKLSSIFVTVCALLLSASCAKDVNIAKVSEKGNEVIITVIASEKPQAEAETKTFIDGTSVKWSESGEKLKVFEVATPAEGDVLWRFYGR